MVRDPVICLTQALPCNASATEVLRFLLGTAANTAERILVPCSQLSIQKKVDCPSPEPTPWPR